MFKGVGLGPRATFPKTTPDRSQDGASMKPDALKWVKARAKLIEQMSQKAEL